jgi:hypothetical protein
MGDLVSALFSKFGEIGVKLVFKYFGNVNVQHLATRLAHDVVVVTTSDCII